MAQKNLVQIEFKNLVFGEKLLKSQCKKRFIGLSDVSSFLAEEKVTRNLHGNSAGTLRLGTRLDIDVDGTENTSIVNTDMFIVSIILSGKYGCNQRRRSIVNSYWNAAFGTIFPHQKPIAGVNSQWYFQFQSTDGFDIRQSWQ